MNERKIVEALGAEIDRAAAAGDRDRAEQLAELQGRVIARISREVVTEGAAEPGTLPPHGGTQLARIARRISTEALSAELAAERGDWTTVHATYEHLGLLFAEYRLAYVQCLAPGASARDDRA